MATVGTSKKARSYTWRCLEYFDQGQEGACVGFAMSHELVARPKKIYWEAQKIDPWEGGSYPGATPVYEGTSVLAGVKILKTLGYIEQYRWAFGLNDLVMAVGYCGPAVLGVPWYEGMFSPHTCGYLHADGAAMGGHAILCKGVDVKARTFTLHNSWGSTWGNGGDALISWAEMEKLLHERGEAVIPMGRQKGLLSRLFGQ
jgi:hypothetical protein